MISYLRSSCVLSNISDQVLEALDIAFEAIDKDDDDQQEGETKASNCTTLAPSAIRQLPPTTTHTATNSATTNFDQLLSSDECSNADSNNVAMDNDKDIEQFIDDLIKQTNEAVAINHQEQQMRPEEGAAKVEEELSDVDSPIQVEPSIEPVVIEDKRIVFDNSVEPIYEIIEDVTQPKPLKSALKSPGKSKEKSPKEALVEPYYEVPPNRKPIPLYENVDIFLASVNDTNQGQMLSTIPAGVNLEPPKMKPPPPPVESESESEEGEDEEMVDETPEENLKRMNSTKRIKKDIRNKRSSFLGIESSQDDELALKLSIAPPPDMSALIEEERRLEKQFLKTYDGIGKRGIKGFVGQCSKCPCFYYSRTQRFRGLRESLTAEQ